MAQQLPVLPSLKITQKAVYVGHPDQLTRLLQADVASAILELKMSKNGQVVFKPKLRCKTLFEGNLPIYFILDYPNLSIQEGADGLSVDMSEGSGIFGAKDVDRASRYRDSLLLALTFWSLKMEDEVHKVFPDRKAEDTTRFHHSGILNLTTNPFQKSFQFSTFLTDCDAKKSLPCFSISYGWVLATEDPRSVKQPWGFRFELSPFAQSTSSSSGGSHRSTAEKQEALLKKRKVEEQTVVVEPVQA